MSKVGLNDRIIFLSEMLWTDEMQIQNMKTEGHPIWNKEFLPSVLWSRSGPTYIHATLVWISQSGAHYWTYICTWIEYIQLHTWIHIPMQTYSWIYQQFLNKTLLHCTQPLLTSFIAQVFLNRKVTFDSNHIG